MDRMLMLVASARPAKCCIEDLKNELALVRAGTAESLSGIFGPQSLTWRIDREAVIFLSAGVLSRLGQIAGQADLERCFGEDPNRRLNRPLFAQKLGPMMTDLFLFWIVTAISGAGYAGVVGLMALESACIPIPSEIIMPFSGYLVSTGRLNLWLVATAGAVGCNIGSTAAYLVGAHGGRTAALRWGRYLLFGAEELDRLDRFFHRFGAAAVLLARLLPIVRTFISLPAGIAKMPLLRFQIYTFLGSWPWCLALAYLGLLLGDQWNSNPTLQAFFRRFDWAVISLLVAGFALYLHHRRRAFRTGGRDSQKDG